MKKLLITLLFLASLFSSPAHGMWSAWTTRLASATHFARKQMTALAKSTPNIMHTSPRTIQKSITQITGHAGNQSVNQSSFWDRISKGLASAWNTFKQNCKLPQWLTSSAAKEQIKKALKSHAQKLSTRAPMIGTLAVAGMQNAHAQGKQQEMPAFTAANIFNYRLYPQHRDAFIAHAIKNIATQDKETIEAVRFLIERYPEAALALTPAAIKEFSNVHPLILKDILLYNRTAAKEYMHALLETVNPHFHDVFNDTGLKNSVLWKPEYVWSFGNQSNEQTFSLASYIIDQVVQNPQSVSVKAYNKLYLRTRIGHWPNASIQLTKAAIQHYGQDAKTMLLVHQGTLKLCDITARPMCVYADSSGYINKDKPSILSLAKAIIHDIRSTSFDDVYYAYQELQKLKNNWWIDYTYDDYLQAKACMIEIRNSAIAHFGTKNMPDPLKIMENQLDQKDAMLASCKGVLPQDTITICHMCANLSTINQLLFTWNKVIQNQSIKNMFAHAHAKQKEEQTKNNHVFFHGRQWGWDYIADLYKLGYNLTKKEADHVKNDYVFLRFDNTKSSWSLMDDLLFMNAALFGNSANSGSCTAQYVMGGTDMSGNLKDSFTPDAIFKSFNLQKYYTKYQIDFNRLAALHTASNPKNYGSLLAVSVPDKEVNRVSTRRSSGFFTGLLGTKRLLDSGAIEDQQEFTLPLDKSYALDPYKGPRIYSFNAADPVKWKEYETARDQLFVKIKADIEKDGVLA